MHTGINLPGTAPHRRLRTLGLLLAAVLLAALLPQVAAVPASAAADELSNTVTGRLVNTAADNAPVEGVEITVTPEGGEAISATSDEDGRFEIVVPGDGGKVLIELDESTMPEGVTLRDPDQVTRTVTLRPGQRLPVLFAIGADTRDVSGKWDQIPQLVYNGLLFGLILAMAALGLSMIFGTTGLTNFAHGELVTFGAVTTYMFNKVFEWPFLFSALMALVLAGMFGWLQDRALWRPLRHRGTGLIAMMIVSIGFQFLLRNLFQYFTGGRTSNYREYVTPAGSDFFGLFTYSDRDLLIAGISIAVLVSVILALSKTRLGRATRAVSDNPALAASTGINVDRVIQTVWIIGTALAALSGVFLGFGLGVTFQIGQLVLLLLFAAVCVGGLGSIWGALIGALIIGVLIEVSTLVIPADLKNAGALLLLIVILLVRPQGLLGRKERVG